MTRIEYLSKNANRAGQFTVRFDNGQSLRLYRQTMEDFGVFTGMELSDAQMQQLLEAAGRMSAKMRAVRIVSAASVSKKDLEQRLIQKGEAPDQAREAVSWMSDLNLVDDRKTAEQLVLRCIAKGYGCARAKQVLYEKRIPRELWDPVLENYPDQTDKIEEFLEKRLGDEPSEKDVKKAVDALLRRGHSYHTIRVALKRYGQDADSCQEE